PHVGRARYYADLGRRRYLAVDPANRLVAESLEADWNTALRAVNDAQHAYEQAQTQAWPWLGDHLTQSGHRASVVMRRPRSAPRAPR
ncbi:MAG: hypothetical protein LC721_13055, partial [Actinobacteria bacterium]|nr:hypothetical protein [Actinomycetota bacterium]